MRVCRVKNSVDSSTEIWLKSNLRSYEGEHPLVVGLTEVTLAEKEELWAGCSCLASC